MEPIKSCEVATGTPSLHIPAELPAHLSLQTPFLIILDFDAFHQFHHDSF